MSQELIELGKTVRDSQKLLNKKLNELLNDAEKKVSEWKVLLNKNDFEKSLRITFVLTMAKSRGSNYYDWNEKLSIAADYIEWRKKFLRSNEKFLYSTKAGFIKLGAVFKSPFERSSRITYVLKLNEKDELEYIYDATTYNGFGSSLCTYHQKFTMNINTHHITKYSSSDDRTYDAHWWISDLNESLKEIKNDSKRKTSIAS